MTGWHRSNRSDVQSRTSALMVRGIPWGDGDTPRNGGSLRGRKGGRCVHDSYYLTLDILLLLCMVLKIEIWFFFLFNSFCQIGFLQKPIHTSLHPIFTQRDRWLKLTLAKFFFFLSLKVKTTHEYQKGLSLLGLVEKSVVNTASYHWVIYSHTEYCVLGQARDFAAKLFRWVFAF